tara:strand:+ start:414 stop:686 length:273 start_codon:yes stop_codon:yes gene_type:complete
MIPNNKIIDDCEIKLANKIRDDSFTKFCNENNCTDIIIAKRQIKEDKALNQKAKVITTKHKIDHIEVKRSYKGEIQCWHIIYKEIKKGVL